MRGMKTTMALIGLAILVSGCAPKSPYLPKEYDPAASARLRVYFGPKMRITLNHNCEDPSRSYSFEANDPLVRGISNTVIGMPMPNTDDKLLLEYVVMAGIPIDIYSRGGGWSHPNSIGVSMHSPVYGHAIRAVLEPGKTTKRSTTIRMRFCARACRGGWRGAHEAHAPLMKAEVCKNVKVDRTPLPMGGNS